MRFNKITAIVMFGCFFFSSCNSFVELQPKSLLTASNFWQTQTDAEAGVSAMYYSFSRAMANGYYDWGEIRGGNYTAEEKFGPDQFDVINNSISTSNSSAPWDNIFQTINRANLGLNYIPQISMNAAVKNNYLGECYAMRALCYFYAVRVWGDVPQYLEPVESYTANGVFRKRTDKNIILQQVLDDLQQAELYIQPVTTSSFKRTRITPMAVYAIMMDVYAWMHNYDMVDRVMTEKVQALSPANSTTAYWTLQAISPTATPQVFGDSWRSIFIEVPGAALTAISKEQIFIIAYNQLENGVNVDIDYFCNTGNKLTPSIDLLGKYATGDKRQLATYVTASGATKLINKFWANGISFSSTPKPTSDNDLLIYRMSDLVLLEAEALANLNRISDAINQLNTIHTRAGLPAYTTLDFISPDELMLAILKERRLELIGEGKYWFDLLRTGHATDIGGVTDPRYYLFPISKSQMDQNPLLVQNPGYN